MPEQRVTVADAARFLCELVAIGSLAAWGAIAFPAPWPGLLVAAEASSAAIALWALFCSPRARFRIGVVGRSAVEALVMGAALAAQLALGWWPLAIAFGATALWSGVDAGVRRARRERASG